MLPIVTTILLPQIDWPTLARVGQEVLGRSLTGAVDQARLKPGSPTALVVILETLGGSSQPTVIKAVKPSTLDHLIFGFLIEADNSIFYEILGLTSKSLALTHNPKGLGILSGTLKDWREVMVIGHNDRSSVDLLSVFNQIFNIFESLGLRNLWSNYNIKQAKLGTFILEEN